MAHGNGHDNAPESPAAQGPTLRVDSPAALRAAAASTMQAGAHALLWQQQLDAVTKGRQELRDQLNREQERSRELESANAQFFSANARDAKSIDRDTEAPAQLSQCRAELAQEREANEEAQKQLASLKRQLDGEQERSRELESANAQFNEGTSRLRNERNALQVQCNELKSFNAQFLSLHAKSMERLRDERKALQEECNELKQARAPAVPPLGENNGQHA